MQCAYFRQGLEAIVASFGIQRHVYHVVPELGRAKAPVRGLGLVVGPSVGLRLCREVAVVVHGCCEHFLGRGMALLSNIILL